MPLPLPTIQAFVLDGYFNSQTTDDPDNPVLPPPSNWGGDKRAGVRGWRREWRVCDPSATEENTWWNPGQRKLKVSMGLPNAPSTPYYLASGQYLAINAWDLDGNKATPEASTMNQGWIYISATTLEGQTLDVSTLFQGFILGEAGSYISPLGRTLSSSNAWNAPYLTLTSRVLPTFTGPAGPDTLQKMNVGCLATLQFANFAQQSSPPQSFKLQIGLFLQLTPPRSDASVWVYDDPEMEVGAP